MPGLGLFDLFPAHDCTSECGNQLIMALSYTQKTSDNSLITKYVRKNPLRSLVGAHMTCMNSNLCMINSARILHRTVCTRRASFPLTTSLVNWQIKRTLVSRCAPPWWAAWLTAPAYGYTPLKSIVALKAASEIFRILGNNDKSQQYNVSSLVLRSRFEPS